jgi:hypothetical protein
MKTTKTKQIQDLLENHTDKEIAAIVGTSHNYVNNIRHYTKARKVSKWSKYEHLLGVSSDTEIGELIGITANAVTRKRLRMGIATDAEMLHKKIVEHFAEKLINPRFEVVTRTGGKIDILTDHMICECKVKLDSSAAFHAIGQLAIYSLDYPHHKKVIVTSEIDLPKNISIKTLASLGIFVQLVRI